MQSGYPLDFEWLHQMLPSGSRLGINPNHISICKTIFLTKNLTSESALFDIWFYFSAKWGFYEAMLLGFQLVPVETDLIDKIWIDDRSPRPNNPLMVHEIQFAGWLHLFVYF